MLGYITCSACQDTWERDMRNTEIQAYIRQHPELEKQILAGEIREVDLGEVLCDGCEDFFQDEADLAEHEDDTDGTHKSWLCGTCGDPAYDCGCDEDDALPPETIKCPYCGRLNSELYCQCMEEDDDDDESSEDIEDEIDRKAELMEHKRL